MTSTHHKTDAEHIAAGDGVQKTPTAARQGIETHRVRWVLGVSLALGVVALGAAWLTYLSVQPAAPPPAAVASSTTPGSTTQ
jgi:hypothetical protein